MPLLNSSLELSPSLLLGESSLPNEGSILRSNSEQIYGGPARLLMADLDVFYPTNIAHIIDLSGTHTLYDPVNGWEDMGATKSGIKLSSQYTSSEYKIDMITGQIEEYPTGYEIKMETNLAEVNGKNIVLAWRGTPVESFQGTEKINNGKEKSNVYKRIAVLFMDPKGKIKAFILRRAEMNNQEITMNYSRTYEAITLPLSFTATPDHNSPSVKDCYGSIINQV